MNRKSRLLECRLCICTLAGVGLVSCTESISLGEGDTEEGDTLSEAASGMDTDLSTENPADAVDSDADDFVVAPPEEISLSFDTSACADMGAVPTGALVADFEQGSSRGVSENSSGFFPYQRAYVSRTVTTGLHQEFPVYRALSGACSDNVLKFEYDPVPADDSFLPPVLGLRIFLQVDEAGTPVPVDISRYRGVSIWYAPSSSTTLDFCLVDGSMYPGDDLTPRYGPWGVSWAMAWAHREQVAVEEPVGWRRLDIDFEDLAPSASPIPDALDLTAVYALQLEFESDPGEIYFDDISFYE